MKICSLPKIIIIWFLLISTISIKGQVYNANTQSTLGSKNKIAKHVYPTSSSRSKTLTRLDGLSSNSVYAILQDKNDFIWIGTKDGLNRYDGYEIISYRNSVEDTASLVHNEIWDLAEDSKGNIWVGTYGGGISKLNPRSEQFKNYTRTLKDSLKISDNYIMSIFIDSQDRIWAGNWYGLDLYNPKKDIFEPIALPNIVNKIFKNATYCIKEDKNHNIWIGTDSAGLICYDPIKKEIIKNYEAYDSNSNPNSLLGSPLTAFTIDANNNLWVQQESYGIVHINSSSDQMEYYSENGSKIPIDNITYRDFIHQDRSGNLLMGRKNKGVQWFNPTYINEYVKATKEEELLTTSLIPNTSNYTANTLLEDRAGSFWIGTQSKGVIYISANEKEFNHKENINDGSNSLELKSIKKIVKDNNGYLWLAGNNFVLARIHPVNGSILTVHDLLPQLKSKNSSINVEDIIVDHHGNIWATTSENGLIHFDSQTLKPTRYYIINNVKTKQPPSITLNKKQNDRLAPLNSILETKEGNLWITSKHGSGLLFYNPKTKYLDSYLTGIDPNSKKYLPGEYINDIYIGLDGNLYVGFFDNGLFVLDKKTERLIAVDYFGHSYLKEASKNVLSMYQNNTDVLWVGTAIGLFKKNLKTEESTLYTVKNGLDNSYISNITGDNNYNLWITTNTGITKFEDSLEVFKNYSYKDGLKEIEYYPGAVYKDNDQLFFGGVGGYNFFNSNQIKENVHVPKISITKFIKKGEKDNFVNLLETNFKKEITVPYSQSDFTVEFAALDYTNSSANKYAYYLEGYNKNWVTNGHKRDVTFTNLYEGTYKLRLKGTNNDGVWNEMEQPLIITVLPPWWRTIWAYISYLLILVFIVYLIYSYWINKVHSAKLKELDHLKSRLFANISHELRTPLTLISGPANLILTKYEGSLETEVKNTLKLIQKNAKSLNNLINDILHLSKLDANKTTLKEKPTNILRTLENCVDNFDLLAKQKLISFTHSYTIIPDSYVFMDVSKLEKIINNVLSNAFKYTPENGIINLVAFLNEYKLQLVITDTGIGISEKDLPHVFSRYFQSKDTHKQLEGGSGIGLALVKEFMELMQGEITLTSTLKKGTKVTLTIPIKLVDPSNMEYVKTNFDPEPLQQSNYNLPTVTFPKNNQKTYVILVVEDTPDMLAYITSILEFDYKVVTAKNGAEAVVLLKSVEVNLIISDIMMPIMDGYTFLETVKQDKRTYNIPFVMLTALSTTDKKLKAFTIGADDYLTKPFEQTELLARAYNLIQRYDIRKKSKITLVSPETESGTKKEQPIALANKNIPLVATVNSQADIKLIETIAKIIEENLENPDFKLSELGARVHVGERHLRRKVKLITGLSPKQFQQETVLKKALKLLENNTYTSVKAVALSVGITNVTRFNTLFENRFGRKPVSYLNV